MKNVTNWLSKIIYVLIACAFIKLMLDIVLQDFVGRTMGNILWRMVQWLLIGVVFAFLYYGIYKKRAFFERYANVIVLIYIVILLFVQVMMGDELRVVPKYDFSAIYHGALDWLVTGAFERFHDYYYYYPNNLGAMSFLMLCFQMASKLGINDYYFVGIVVNSLMSLIMVWFTYLIVKRFFSVSEAFMAVLIYAIYPPMYLLGAVFYTDELTMIFPVALILAYYIMAPKEKTLPIVGWSLFIAVAGVIGYLLKPTVLIVWIAMVCLLFLARKWKHLVAVVACFVVIFGVFNYGFDSYIYSNHLDKEKAQMLNTPTETWVLMGLNENPGFSPEDTEFSRSIADPAERKEIVRQEIVNRIKTYGVIGIINHLEKKGVMVFGDGTFELSYTFLFGFESDTKLEKSITLLGENYPIYWEVCSAIWYVILFYGMCAMVCDAWWAVKGKTVDLRNLIISLSVFGLLCFLLMWEVHSRYSVNYFSCFVILAANGVAKVCKKESSISL